MFNSVSFKYKQDYQKRVLWCLIRLFDGDPGIISCTSGSFCGALGAIVLRIITITIIIVHEYPSYFRPRYPKNRFLTFLEANLGLLVGLISDYHGNLKTYLNDGQFKKQRLNSEKSVKV